MKTVFDKRIGDGIYQRAALELVAQAARAWPELPPQAIALGTPPWFARRLAAEIGLDMTRAAGGLDVVHLPEVSVVGVPSLDREPLGTFVAQDLLQGSCHHFRLRCHRDVNPARWLSLTHAVDEGLHPALAVAIATMEP